MKSFKWYFHLTLKQFVAWQTTTMSMANLTKSFHQWIPLSRWKNMQAGPMSGLKNIIRNESRPLSIADGIWLLLMRHIVLLVLPAMWLVISLGTFFLKQVRISFCWPLHPIMEKLSRFCAWCGCWTSRHFQTINLLLRNRWHRIWSVQRNAKQ